MALPQFSEPSRTNPLDVVERIASINDWSFERAGDDEITIMVAGRWSDYQVSFTWMNDIEALHLACAFDLKVPSAAAARSRSSSPSSTSSSGSATSTCGPTTAW